MVRPAREFTLADVDRPSPPLTAAERAAVRRAEADVRAGRLHDHDTVAERLRRRAVEIVEKARARPKPR